MLIGPIGPNIGRKRSQVRNLALVPVIPADLHHRFLHLMKILPGVDLPDIGF